MGQSDDDIDKLLREVEAMTSGASGGPAKVPAERASAQPATGRAALPAGRTGSSRGGRVAWTGVGAVGGLLSGGIVGTVLAFLPSVGTLSTAVGAAIGGAVVAFVSGPPGWFDRE